MKTKMNNQRFWTGITLLALLAGCGGGGGGGDEGAPVRPNVMSGKVDTTYGTAGKVRAAPGAVSVEFAFDGSAFPYGSVLWKIDSEGVPDVSFGGGAPVPLDPSGHSSVALDETSNVFYTFVSGIAKLDAQGGPVPSFGEDGRFLINGRGSIAQWQLARCAAGNLYLGMFNSTGGGFQESIQQAVMKVAPVGTTATYGAGGVAPVPFEERPATVLMRTDPDGSLYVTSNSFSHPQHAVAKLDPLGRPALLFGNRGVWVNDICSSFEATAMRSDGAGSVFVAGYCGASQSHDPLVLRLDSLGRNESFRDGGRRGGIFGPGSIGRVADVLAERAGDVYVAGSRLNASGCPEAAVAKLDRNGNVVEAFGEGGLAVLPPGSGSSVAVKLAKDFEGRLYVVASVSATCAPAPQESSRPALEIYRLGG